MHPILFKIFGFEVHTFGVMIAIAFVASLSLARKRAPRWGISADDITDASVVTILLGVLGARVVFILQDLPHYLKNLHELFSVQFEGLTSFGGILFGFIYLAIWSARRKIPLVAVLDVVAGPLLVGQAIGRVGCLFNGCCYGGLCPVGTPWGIHVDTFGDLHHPAQIYESFMDLGGLFLLLRMEKRGLSPGQSFAAGLMLYGMARFIYEFWRLGSTSSALGPLPISDAQVVAASMVIVGFALFLIFKKRATVRQELFV